MTTTAAAAAPGLPMSPEHSGFPVRVGRPAIAKRVALCSFARATRQPIRPRSRTEECFDPGCGSSHRQAAKALETATSCSRLPRVTGYQPAPQRFLYVNGQRPGERGQMRNGMGIPWAHETPVICVLDYRSRPLWTHAHNGLVASSLVTGSGTHGLAAALQDSLGVPVSVGTARF